MAFINNKTPAEIPQHWLDHFSAARVKPSPFDIIGVDQALLRSWTRFLSPLYKNKCPFAIQPVKELLFQHKMGPLVQFRTSYNGAWESSSMKHPLRRPCPPEGHRAAELNAREFSLPHYLYKGKMVVYISRSGIVRFSIDFS